MTTKKTHGTGTCRLLVKVALVGATMAVPMTAVTVPAIAASAPDVVLTDSPRCGRNDYWCDRDRDYGRCDRDRDYYWRDDYRWRSDRYERCDYDRDYGWGSNNWFPRGWFGSS
ncbi:hypothetical protein [Nocardia sp. NPDC050710]|uniref:hypothetical protein n=1 Tax=Nocardia sp. NPDC050710 TaxID=3157220 RepID=UPI0033E7B4C1